MDLEFRDLVYEVPSPKRGKDSIRILDEVSGSLTGGESLAILGPSGCGKTTLLNIFAGRNSYELAGGCVRFNGAPRTSRTKRDIGYVTQDDLFFSRLSVRETLQFTASVRISSSLSPEEKKKRIDKLVEELRLTRCLNTLIGGHGFKGISGGERKRLNIANELIPDPAILLADECTSGLDSSSALTVIQLLRQLSHEGKTVICSIHQPSSQMFNLFDKIMLLSSGRVAYFGRPSDASQYFASIGHPFPNSFYNPADFLLELVIDDLPMTNQSDPDVENGLSTRQSAKKKILDAWIKHRRDIGVDDEVLDSSLESAGSGVPSFHKCLSDFKTGPWRALKKRYWTLTNRPERDVLPDKYPVSFSTQVLALMKRSLRQQYASLIEPMSVVHMVAVTTMCLLFWFRLKPTESTIQDRLGALFFFNLFWSWSSVLSAVLTFPSERAVLNKDRASGVYRLSAYYVAKTIVGISVDLLYPLIFTIICYWGVGLNPMFRQFVLHTTTLLLSVVAALSGGVVISAVFERVKAAQVTASLWILFSMLCGGYFIGAGNFPVFLRPIVYTSFLKFGYEALVRIEAHSQRFECVQASGLHTIYSANGKECPVDEKALLRAANIDENISLRGNLTFLLLWIFVLRLAGYFALKYLHRNYKPRR